MIDSVPVLESALLSHEMVAFIANFESIGKRSLGRSCDKFPNIWRSTDPLLKFLILEGSLVITTDCCKAKNHTAPSSVKFATSE